ncbi:MAG: hypothetical protein J5I47_07705 [Vicingus serpentipes]|nr:hypothetical protein [Vicingus serpentipes]
MEDRKGKTYIYSPSSTTDPMSGRKGENLSPYYGPILSDIVLKEIEVWAKVLDSIKNGIPKPYDSSILIKKIIKIENQTGEDLSFLKNCCPPSANILEAKEVKPVIFGILDRIIEIGQLENYIKHHEQED